MMDLSTEPTDAAPAAVPSNDDGLEALFDKLNDEEVSDETATEEPDEDSSDDASGDAAPEPKEQDQEPNEGGEPGEPAIAKPSSWSAEMGEAWGTLPRTVQEYVAKREREAHTQISQLGAKAKQADPYLQLADQYGHLAETAGVEPVRMMEMLFNAQALLNEDPVIGIMQIAQSYGVDLNQIGHEGNHEVAQLRREVAAYRAEHARKESSQQAREVAQTTEAIESWKADKPHYEAVEADMALIVSNMPRAEREAIPTRELLDQVYAKACRMNDQVWSAIQAGQETAEKREARERKRIADAERGKRLKSGVGSAVPNGKALDLDDDDAMARLYDEIQSR